MGITIHYAGRAKSEDSIVDVYKDSLLLAKKFGWQIQDRPTESLRANGIEFIPHPDCEPLHIRFSRTRRFSEFCKTQFAGPIVHQQILELLQKVSQHLSQLIIYDEAEEFEDDGKPVPVKEAFAIALKFIEDGAAKYPGAQIKVRLPNGRIADLIN